MLLINYINSHPGDSSLPPADETPPPYYDPSHDGACTAVDVLMVINYINSHVAGNVTGQGEAAPVGPKWKEILGVAS